MKKELDICHSWDKIGLFIIAGLVVLVLGTICYKVFGDRGVPDKGDVLLSGIATGLILFLRDIVTALRASWDEDTRRKTNEQLSNSAPTTPTPEDAKEAADQVSDAAAEEARRISQ